MKNDVAVAFTPGTIGTKFKHDPGGKVKLKLRGHISGGATFSDCGRYRPLLWRSWDEFLLPGYVLWIGMNPSTAAEDVDDPTVRRECDFTASWGYGRYHKCNVMDLRATKPQSLLEPTAIPRSTANLDIILEHARKAELVILAFGSLHKKLAAYGDDVVQALRNNDIRAKCMGLTANGSPKHPLYLKKETTPQPFC